MIEMKYENGSATLNYAQVRQRSVFAKDMFRLRSVRSRCLHVSSRGCLKLLAVTAKLSLERGARLEADGTSGVGTANR